MEPTSLESFKNRLGAHLSGMVSACREAGDSHRLSCSLPPLGVHRLKQYLRRPPGQGQLFLTRVFLTTWHDKYISESGVRMSPEPHSVGIMGTGRSVY